MNQTTDQLPTPTERPRRFISLRVRFLVMFTVMFTIFMLGANFWLRDLMLNTAWDQVTVDLQDTMDVTRQFLNGDEIAWLAHEAANQNTAATDSPEYAAMMGSLQTVADVKPYAIVYIYTWGSQPDEVVFLGGASVYQGLGPDFLDTETITLDNGDPILEGLDHNVIADEIVTDEFGDFTYGYQPIHDSSGQIVAAVGVDFDATYVHDLQDEIAGKVLPIISILYGVGALVVFGAGTIFTRPFKALKGGADSVAQGKYEVDLSRMYTGRFQSEVSDLARAIEGSGRAHIREQVLMQKVHQLEIQIDQSKANAQIDEITDSDFFRDLKGKATKLREERSDTSAESDSR